MADVQDIARAFAPFIAIEEFENVLSVNSKTRVRYFPPLYLNQLTFLSQLFPTFTLVIPFMQPPVFLRRNLSYSASRQDRVERDQSATSVITLKLETMNLPAAYKTSLPILAVLCSISPGALGAETLIPLAAKMGRIAIPKASAGTSPSPSAPGGKPTCTLSMKVPLPDVVLPKDTVILVLYKSKYEITKLR